MNKIEESMNKLTTIPKSNLSEVMDIVKEVICDEVLNEIDGGNDVATVDIGIGKLSMLINDDSIEYKFVPHISLEEMIVKAVETGDSPLVKHIEKCVTKRVITAYKNLM